MLNNTPQEVIQLLARHISSPTPFETTKRQSRVTYRRQGVGLTTRQVDTIID